MRVLAIGGAGKIGQAIVWDLVRYDEVERVSVADVSATALKNVTDKVSNSKVQPRVILDEIGEVDWIALRRLMEQVDVAIISVPQHKTSYMAIQMAIESGVHVVDILEEYHRVPASQEIQGLTPPDGMSLQEYGEWLHQQAVAHNVTAVDGLGFAPGLSNVTIGEGIRRLDVIEDATARVGGIPAKAVAERHPLRYMITWSFSNVLREYVIDVEIVRNSKVVTVPALSEYEQFRFDAFGKDEALECFITPGMPSFIHTRPDLPNFSEKTIRWPGHRNQINTLKECGLFDLNPVKVKIDDALPVTVVPRAVLLATLEPRLRQQADETDVCVMWNTVSGEKDHRQVTISYRLWHEADTRNGLSAMAQVTGFPAVTAAMLLARGEIKIRGIVAPEDCISGPTYAVFMQDLERKGIWVEEKFE